jgi:hypothetical protein
MHGAVKVVWGKEKLSVELDETEDPDTFRAQLFALTQVDPDRMKLMFKGKVITVSSHHLLCHLVAPPIPVLLSLFPSLSVLLRGRVMHHV